MYMCSTPYFVDDQMNCMLKDLRNDISNIHTLLQAHITESSRQMGILKDEITGIKSHVTVHCNSVSQQLEMVETSTKQIETLILTSTQTVQSVTSDQRQCKINNAVRSLSPSLASK